MNPSPARRVPIGLSWLLVGVAVAFLLIFLALPLICVFAVAFSKGSTAFLAAVGSPETLSAVSLTLLAAAASVPLNTALGFAAAWSVTKFDFRGKALLSALIDLPIAVSPVVAGLVFVFLFGARGLFGPTLQERGWHVIYAPLGVILATAFVTFPFVARELIPLMESVGRDEEIAAASLGANGWHMFWRITLPNVRWGLLYGIIACTARAVGEFGAVSVVSGHIRGETNTLSLHVEALHHEYNQAGAFAVASLVTVVGLFALVAKKLVGQRAQTVEGK